MIMQVAVEQFAPDLRVLRVYRIGVWLLALGTAALIYMGGLVTSHQAGMSVPDWPNSYGYNMFLFPPSQWVGGIFYEHTHRLMGSLVGMVSIALLLVAWIPRWRRRPGVSRLLRWLSVWLFVGVTVQGILGGLRVRWVILDMAIVHACFAQAFCCLIALTCLASSTAWQAVGDKSADNLQQGKITRGFASLAGFCALAIYGQLIIGAVMRHYAAGLAIPDLPLAYGNLLPPTTEAGLTKINAWRTWQAALPPVSMAQVWLHFAHRLGALLVTVCLLTLAARAWGFRRQNCRVFRMAMVVVLLLGVQVTLGVLTVLFRKPADIASLHVVAGALLLACTFALASWTLRLRHFPTPASAGDSTRRISPAQEGAGWRQPVPVAYKTT